MAAIAQLNPTLPKKYIPRLTETERQAYAAAHQILTRGEPIWGLGTPGGRHSREIDRVAKIIMRHFGEEPVED